MIVTPVCAVIRTLKEANKFGEQYRIDFHRYHADKDTIKEHVQSYEIDTLERAYQMLRGDTWVRDHYDVLKIVEMAENAVIPGQETPMLETLEPAYLAYKLDIKQFEGYVNRWLKKEKGIDVAVQVHGENDGGYGYFSVTIPKKAHHVFAKHYNLLDYVENIEYEVIQPLMYELFASKKINYTYDVKQECLMVYKPIT